MSFLFDFLWKNQSPSVTLKEHFINLDEDIADSVKKEAGRGAYGAVFEVKYQGSVCIAKRVLDILSGLGSQQFVDRRQYEPLLDKFRAECDLLSKLRHPNVVQFLGICQPSPDPRDITLVMEKLEMDLERFIGKCKPISLDVKLRILCDVSAGLLHIHSHNVIHRDLSARNVLLTQDLRAKVADFGMSRILPEGTGIQRNMTVVPGAPDYMPPEAVNGNYNEKLDTFSFGHLTLFLMIEEYPSLTHFTPKQLQDMDRNLIIEVEKRRKWIDKMGRDHILYQLIVECLNDEPELRPTINAINQRIALQLNSKKQNSLVVNSQMSQCKSAIMEMIQKLPEFFTDELNLQSVDQDEFAQVRAELIQTRQQLSGKETELDRTRQQLSGKDIELTQTKKQLDQTRQQLSVKETELDYQTRYTQQLSAELDRTKRRLSDKFTLELEQARQQSTDENIKFKAELEASLRQQLTDKQKIELEQAKAELLTRYKQRLAEKEAELEQQFADKYEQAKETLNARFKQELIKIRSRGDDDDDGNEDDEDDDDEMLDEIADEQISDIKPVQDPEPSKKDSETNKKPTKPVQNRDTVTDDGSELSKKLELRRKKLELTSGTTS